MNDDLAPLIDELAARVPNPAGVGCFMCGLILEDIGRNGRPTGALRDFQGSSTFTPAGMVRHLDLEGMICLVPTGWLGEA